MNLQVQYTLDEVRQQGIDIKPYADTIKPIVRAYDLLYMRFQRPDLDRTCKDLTHFGLFPVLQTKDLLLMRACNEAPYCYINEKGDEAKFVGYGVSVSSRKDLEKLAKLDGASPIHNLDMPGGGECVTLHDPAGFQVDVIYGQQQVEALEDRDTSTLNLPNKKARVNDMIRWDHKTPHIHRLGHLALKTVNQRSQVEWLRKTLGVLISDIHYLEDGTPTVAFLRFDRGKEPCHMHKFAVATYVENDIDHAGFEMLDMDAVAFAHRYLKEGKKGWQSVWGIGRHWLASAVFDYWSDSDGYMHEHFADEDVFDADHPTYYSPMAGSNLYMWGPEPPVFFKPTPKNIWKVLKAVAGKNEVQLKHILMAKKAIAR